MTARRDLSDFEFRLLPTADITAGDYAVVCELFRASYRQADLAYIEKSLSRLGYLAIAYHDGRPAGFALGETRVMDLPRLPRQVVSLAGICCVGLEFRRRGLFGALEGRVLSAAPVPRAERQLSCGRMAHPASFKVMGRSPSVVPRWGMRPTRWQKEVGTAIAEAYGVHGFDPETFVCIGSGTPIGYPIIDIEAEAWEWELFKPVNRDRGDSLLSISWGANPPPGWDAVD
ncbi:MAG TPA: hypothetical protein VNN10_05770 [Dehalococcoidia bacterium]|nr:hypothetical protein [Dehalococcoidia bacterium]